MQPIAATSKSCYGDFLEVDLNSGKEAVAIREKYGFDLEYKLCTEAMNSSSLRSQEDLASKHAKQLQYLYRGGALGDKAYAVLANRENKSIAYSTPDITVAQMYSGCDCNYGTKLRAYSQS